MNSESSSSSSRSSEVEVEVFGVVEATSDEACRMNVGFIHVLDDDVLLIMELCALKGSLLNIIAMCVYIYSFFLKLRTFFQYWNPVLGNCQFSRSLALLSVTPWFVYYVRVSNSTQQLSKQFG